VKLTNLYLVKITWSFTSTRLIRLHGAVLRHRGNFSGALSSTSISKLRATSEVLRAGDRIAGVDDFPGGFAVPFL